MDVYLMERLAIISRTFDTISGCLRTNNRLQRTLVKGNSQIIDTFNELKFNTGKGKLARAQILERLEWLETRREL